MEDFCRAAPRTGDKKSSEKMRASFSHNTPLLTMSRSEVFLDLRASSFSPRSQGKNKNKRKQSTRPQDVEQGMTRVIVVQPDEASEGRQEQERVSSQANEHAMQEPEAPEERQEPESLQADERAAQELASNTANSIIVKPEEITGAMEMIVIQPNDGTELHGEVVEVPTRRQAIVVQPNPVNIPSSDMHQEPEAQSIEPLLNVMNHLIPLTNVNQHVGPQIESILTQATIDFSSYFDKQNEPEGQPVKKKRAARKKKAAISNPPSNNFSSSFDKQNEPKGKPVKKKRAARTKRAAMLIPPSNDCSSSFDKKNEQETEPVRSKTGVNPSPPSLDFSLSLDKQNELEVQPVKIKTEKNRIPSLLDFPSSLHNHNELETQPIRITEETIRIPSSLDFSSSLDKQNELQVQLVEIKPQANQIPSSLDFSSFSEKQNELETQPVSMKTETIPIPSSLDLSASLDKQNEPEIQSVRIKEEATLLQSTETFAAEEAIDRNQIAIVIQSTHQITSLVKQEQPAAYIEKARLKYGLKACSVVLKRLSEKAKPTNKSSSPYKYYPCPQCDRRFCQKATLKAHLGVHDTGFNCGKCGRVYSNRNEFKFHTLNDHTTNKPIKCQNCEKSFASVEMKDIHYKRVHIKQQQKVECDRCGAKISKAYLPKHIKFVHERVKNFKCEICGKKYYTGVLLLNHAKTVHSTEDRFECMVCGFLCKHRYALKLHLKGHSAELKHKCEICEKQYRFAAKLKAHKLVHHGIGTPYKCDKCGKTFNDKKSHSDHMLKHAGKTPYVCDVCNKGFVYRNAFHYHKKTHEGIRFKCKGCGKQYRQLSTLKRHIESSSECGKEGEMVVPQAVGERL